MARPWLVVLVILSAGGFVLGQSSDRFEVFGGYSYLTHDYGLGSTNGVNGWSAAANFKARPWVGVVADFSSFYPGSFNPCSTCSSSPKEYTFLFGPQLSLPQRRITPFAHFLVGFSHLSGDLTGANNTPLLTSNNSLSLAGGGGVDISLTRRIAFRAGVDWLHNKFTAANSQALTPSSNVARISTGLVFRF